MYLYLSGLCGRRLRVEDVGSPLICGSSQDIDGVVGKYLDVVPVST